MSNLDQTTDSYAARVHEVSLTLWKVWHEALQLEESEKPLSPHLHYSEFHCGHLLDILQPLQKMGWFW